MDCDEEGAVKNNPPLQQGMSPNPSASSRTDLTSDAASAPDDDTLGSTRKRKRPNFPTNTRSNLLVRKSIESHLALPSPPEASAYDPEHSKLHIEIYNYFSGLHSQLLGSEAIRGGRERNLRAGVSVKGIGELLTKLEKTFRHVGEYKRSQDEIRKRKEEEEKNAQVDESEEKNDSTNSDSEKKDGSNKKPSVNPISLSMNPTSLMDLWKEYKFGIDGRKPAQQFTRKERNSSNAIKQTYSRRNQVWSVMNWLVKSGLNPEEACQEIISLYGKLSVTNYIDCIIKDKKRNPVSKCHPKLFRLLRQDDAVQARPAAEDGPAELSDYPETLIDLWMEYKFGLEGRKPAQRFTRKERNADAWLKQNYYRRNIVWMTMERLVGAGNTPEEACRRIEEAYPGKSNTGIISAMIADKRRYPETKCHPSLV